MSSESSAASTPSAHPGSIPGIIYTHTDEAPLLATYSLLPIIEAYAAQAGVPVETRDISLAGRIIAAFADRHYSVVKSSDGSVTTSGVQALDDQGRRSELSRMLAGLEDSETALAHADELVELARQERASA